MKAKLSGQSVAFSCLWCLTNRKWQCFFKFSPFHHSGTLQCPLQNLGRGTTPKYHGVRAYNQTQHECNVLTAWCDVGHWTCTTEERVCECKYSVAWRWMWTAQSCWALDAPEDTQCYGSPQEKGRWTNTELLTSFSLWKCLTIKFYKSF
jgi:hypothetical protein